MNRPGNRAELVWVALTATLILALSSLPTWAGRAAQNEHITYRGIYFDEQDYAVHIAMMHAGRQGDWAYQLRFTSEAHRPVYIRMFYVVLGHLSEWLGMMPEPAYHLARWLLGYTALYAIYNLCRRIFSDLRWVWSAFVLAAAGSGLGWLQLITGWIPGEITPIDYWLIDVYVFFCLSLFPHFALTITLMVTSLVLCLEFLGTGAAKNILLIALMAVITQFINPIAFIVVDAAFAGAVIFHWWQKRRIIIGQVAGLLMIAVVQLPLLIYNFVLLSRDPFWSQFTSQNQTLSPSPVYYLWGFGQMWPLALAGAITAFRSRDPAIGAALGWVVCGFVLAYAPFGIQRRFLLAITIPLAVLAVRGLIEILKYVSARSSFKLLKPESLAFGYVMLAIVSSLYLSLGSVLFMRTQPREYFYPAELDNALAWLGTNAAPDDFILGGIETGQLVAQRAGLKVFLGHEIETLDFELKLSQVEAYYQGAAPDDWLLHTGVDWVVYGPYEQEIAPDFKPDLKPAYDSGTVKIYDARSPLASHLSCSLVLRLHSPRLTSYE